jgi:hypothetical protein
MIPVGDLCGKYEFCKTYLAFFRLPVSDWSSLPALVGGGRGGGGRAWQFYKYGLSKEQFKKMKVLAPTEIQ